MRQLQDEEAAVQWRDTVFFVLVGLFFMDVVMID